MVGISICFGVQPKMITSAGCNAASRMSMSRDWTPGLSNAHRNGPNLGNSFGAIDLQLGRKISSQGVVGCSNFPLRGLSLAEGRGLGDGSSCGAIPHSSFSSRRVKACNKLKNGREEAVNSSPKEEDEVEKKEVKETSIGEKEGGLVESIESELGRQFGGALWFAVLLLSLAFFAGGYVYFIVTYADFNDIPILRGPQR